MEKLLCSFLDNRKASIRIPVDQYMGAVFDLTCGVPQGSGPSTTPFIMYTSDLPPPIRNLNITYADDIAQITSTTENLKRS